MQEFQSLLSKLTSEGVHFVIVGGVAMVLQGAGCVTFDLDVAVAISPENATSIVRALAPFNPVPTHFPMGTPFVWDERSIIGAVASLRTTLGVVDLLFRIPGIESYEELELRSELREFGEMEVRVASLHDLVSMKRAANRGKDAVHLSQLEALIALREERPGRA